MLHRFGAGAHRGAAARVAVRMNGDRLVIAMRRLDGDAHLVVGERLHAGDVLKAAGRAVHLDPIGAGIDLRLDGDANLRRVLHASARRPRWRALARRRRHLRESEPGDEHARPDHRALVDRIAHGDVGVVRCAEIAHGRDAGLERLERIRRRGHDYRILRARTRHRRIRLVAPVRHVRVHVDHARDRGIAAQVDHARARWHGARAGADTHDGVALAR